MWKLCQSFWRERRRSGVEHVHKWEKTVVAQKTYYDKKHKDVQFTVGDLVLLSTQNLRLKGILHKLQHGSFVVLTKFWRKLGLNHTVLDSLTRGESTQFFMCRCLSSGGLA